jgi:hypothetical protein
VLTTLRFFWTAPQSTEATGVTGYRGFYYHFLDMDSGRRTWESEVSTVDSAFLIAGALLAAQYFDRADADERRGARTRRCAVPPHGLAVAADARLSPGRRRPAARGVRRRVARGERRRGRAHLIILRACVVMRPM